MSADGSNLYRIHGLLVESEIPLLAGALEKSHGAPEAGPDPTRSDPPIPDYSLTELPPRDCPYSPPPGRILAEFRDDGFAYWVAESRGNPHRWTLRYAGICDVTLDRHRRTISVRRSPEAEPGMISVFLEGGVLAHVLSAEGVLVLHASAVEVEGVALAIVGPSGAGKSTLAALLCAAGARLVADDALRVDATGSGARCFPGSRRLRLRPAAASLGHEIRGAALAETVDGRTAVLPADTTDAPLELRAAIVPEPSRTAKHVEVRRLGAMDALQELLRHPRLTMWQASRPIAQLFELTAEVAAELPLYRARVPWGPPFPPGLADELLARLGLPDAAPGPEVIGPGAAPTSNWQGDD